jgi:hypothetical protein
MTQVTSMTFALQESDLLRARATANRFDPHLHSTYSVVVLKSGTAEIRSERWSRTVRSGDVFFFNPYEVHSARCLEEGADYETLYPSREFIDEVVAPAVSGGALQIQTDVLSRHSHTDELLEALSSASVDNGAVETALRKVLALCAFTTEPSVHESDGHRADCLPAYPGKLHACDAYGGPRTPGGGAQKPSCESVHEDHRPRATDLYPPGSGRQGPGTHMRGIRAERGRADA